MTAGVFERHASSFNVCRLGARSFRELRAWQTSRTFKVAIQRLCETRPLANDFRLRDQLRESAASAVSHIAEGFGRFSPGDFGRFMAMAKASLIEVQNHLEDAVDRGHITECRATHDTLAETALREVTAFLEYLQSPKAAENAQKARARRLRIRTSRRKPRT